MTTTHQNAPLLITMGDPTGIGPETIVRALANQQNAQRLIVVGQLSVMQRAAKLLKSDLQFAVIDGPHEADFSAPAVPLIQAGNSDNLPSFGKVSAASGKAAFDAILKAIDFARSGQASGIVTAPIHKEAFAAAGVNFPGHTEILGHYSGAKSVSMMLCNDEIKTVLVTIHCSLREAIEKADFAAQMEAIHQANAGAKALGITAPKVAVAGLNPHAGEGGLFGREEIDIISPAIEAARAQGIDVSGPWPGDTVFMQAKQGKFDVVVAQYHDQGLIPVKYMGLEKGVNITLGLPFIRTSPDHGTAFDIAGKGIADATSLKTAIAYARQLVAAKSS